MNAWQGAGHCCPEALLNCSSDLSCLGPRSNRAAINLSSRDEWEEGLGEGSALPSALGPSSAQRPLPWVR